MPSLNSTSFGSPIQPHYYDSGQIHYNDNRFRANPFRAHSPNTRAPSTQNFYPPPPRRRNYSFSKLKYGTFMYSHKMARGRRRTFASLLTKFYRHDDSLFFSPVLAPATYYSSLPKPILYCIGRTYQPTFFRSPSLIRKLFEEPQTRNFSMQ